MQPLYYDLPEHSMIFIATPKCATSSLMDALTPLLGLETSAETINPHVRWTSHQITPKQARELKPERFIFAPVRNPWSRVVSHYKDKIVAGLHARLAQYGFQQAMPFQDYLRVLDKEYHRINDVHILEQTKLLSFKGTYLPDFTLRFERIGPDFDALCAMIKARTGASLQNLGQLNQRPSRSYETYYDDHLRSFVERIYAQDISRLNYTFTPLEAE